MPDFLSFPDIRTSDDLYAVHQAFSAWRVKVNVLELDQQLVQRLGCIYRPHSKFLNGPDPKKTGSPLDTLPEHRRVVWTTDVTYLPLGRKQTMSYGVVEFRGHRYYVCTD